MKPTQHELHVHKLAERLLEIPSRVGCYVCPYGGHGWFLEKVELDSGVPGIKASPPLRKPTHTFCVALPIEHQGATAPQAYRFAVGWLLKRIDQYESQRAVAQALETLG